MAEQKGPRLPDLPPAFQAGELNNFLLEVAHATKVKDRREAVSKVVKKITGGGTMMPLVDIISTASTAEELQAAQIVLSQDEIWAMYAEDQFMRGIVCAWYCALACNDKVDEQTKFQALSNAQTLLCEGPVNADAASKVRQLLETTVATAPDDPATDMVWDNVVANVLTAIQTAI